MKQGLVLEKLSFSRKGRSVLKGIQLHLKRGEIAGLIGPNGAGKTSLLKLMAKLLPPSGGRILLDGEPIENFPRNRLAQHVSYLPQNPALSASFCCREVVLMGRYARLSRFQQISHEDLRAVEQAMSETGTSAFSDRAITALSAGERQRVLLARSIAQGADFLLLDEPTANLDPHYQVDLFKLAKSLAKQNKGVLIAIHDLNLAAAYCKCLFLLHAGDLLKEGPAEAVLTPSLLRAVYRIQADIIRSPKTGRLSIFPEKIKIG